MEIDTEGMETEENEETEDGTTEEDSQHPWPQLGDMFVYVGRKDESFKMRCKLCLPPTVIMAYKNSASNLKKHVKRKHSSRISKYNDLMAAGRQKKTESKQTTLADKFLTARSRVLHATLDGLIINFVCETLQPFSVVEQPSFKELVTALHPQNKVMSRPTLRNKIAEATATLKKTLITELDQVKYIATTTDCWSAHQKSYLGVTCHWIDEESLERKSAALACKRLKGSHTFDVLAAALDNIHSQYNIRSKVIKTTTDSGSNSIKAFHLFGAHNDEDNDLEPEDSDQDDQIQYNDTSSILEEDSGLEYQLPPHQRCACHLLNLVATTDAALADGMQDTYKKLSRSVFAKCHAIWNKAGRSYVASDMVEDNCGLQLIRPNATRWNSTYLAIERLLRVMDEKGEETIRRICDEFKVKMFSPVEVIFLREYCNIMKPLLKATNILQSDSGSSMGWLLPVIHQLELKLRRLEASCKTCLPLVSALQKGLQKRFGQMMEDPELVAAAILLPKFKTTWTDKAHMIEAGLKYLNQNLDSEQLVVSEQQQQRKESSDEDDFFSKPVATKTKSTAELDGYLACASDSMDLLHTFPVIKQLSLKLNTGLAASAACERLFSCAGQIFTSKRSRLDSVNFENQLLMKLNKKFRK